MDFLVTTHAECIPKGKQIVMVDGTVPGWKPVLGDLHYDHHRPGGGMCQLEELPLEAFGQRVLSLDRDCVFVTTQVDADACVAAASLMIASSTPGIIDLDGDWVQRFMAIALDCDHLCIPRGYPHLKHLARFAADVVAGLKERGDLLKKEMGLPRERAVWTKEQCQAYTSSAFEQGAIALYEAVVGGQAYPTAKSYWEHQSRKQERFMLEQRLSLLSGHLFIDLQGWEWGYLDPRCPLWAAREMGLLVSSPVTLTRRDRVHPSGITYIVGVDQSRREADKVDLHPLWSKLTAAERQIDPLWGGESGWGGRITVGGSSWNAGSNLSPEMVIRILSDSN